MDRQYYLDLEANDPVLAADNKRFWSRPFYNWRPPDSMYEGRPTGFEIESEQQGRFIQHGDEGHTGWRCAMCAPKAHRLYPKDSAGHWAAMQLAWQEECDRIQNGVDQRLLAHARARHQGPCECDLDEPVMPPKPVAPYER